MRAPLVVVAGPTGSGKSALGLYLAATFAGEIVNCDSVQLYRGFDIGAAKTPAAERRGVPHHLIDVLDPHELFSAGDYGRAARAVVTEIADRGPLPVVVGGTGFYLRALLDGLPALPPRNETLRAKLEAREQRRPGSLQRLLRRLEPHASEKIHARDTQKTIRALEVRLLTRAARPTAHQAAPLAGFRILQLALSPDRTLLAEAIALRARRMFDGGLLEEVRGLLAAGCTGEEKPFESLGYKQALAHLRGEIDRAQAIASTEIQTRQYAKRQWTWFRRDARIVWLDGFGADTAIQDRACELVRERLLS